MLVTLNVETDEERQALTPEAELAAVSAQMQLKTPITRITMTDQDPPIVTLYLGEVPVRMGDSQGLLDIRTFRTKIANTARQVIKAIPNKKGEWDALVQIMLDNVENVEVGPEGTLVGVVGQWVTQYIEDSGIDLGASTTPDWEDNALNNMPLIRDGVTHFSTQGERGLLKGWMKFNASETMTSRQLAPILIQNGWHKVELSWRDEDNRPVKRRYWGKSVT